MPVAKSRRAIAEADVPRLFDDTCIEDLAKLSPLPATADRQIFANGIREVACVFARDIRIPNANDLSDEIKKLHRTAEARQFEKVAILLTELSQIARDWLTNRADRISRNNVGKRSYPRVSAIGRNGQVLTRKPTAPLSIAPPSPDDLRDKSRREDACATVAMLCRTGGRYVEGRRRPTGKRSKSNWQWELSAPEKTRHPARRKVEREFVGGLREVWLKSTGKAPSRTADRRNLGPFARLVQECLRLVGVYDGNTSVAEMINQCEGRRRELRNRMQKQIRDLRRKTAGQRQPYYRANDRRGPVT